MLTRARNISEKYHMLIHMLVGIAVIYVLIGLGIHFSPENLLILVIMAIIPDIEHLIYFGTYGRKHQYTIDAWEVLRTKGFKALYAFLSQNHKFNTSLYLHNAITPVAFFVVGILGYLNGFYILAGCCFVITSHYVYDIIEDILMSGKLNPNWFLRFNKEATYKKRN